MLEEQEIQNVSDVKSTPWALIIIFPALVYLIDSRYIQEAFWNAATSKYQLRDNFECLFSPVIMNEVTFPEKYDVRLDTENYILPRIKSLTSNVTK